jgi:hypothetical protein
MTAVCATQPETLTEQIAPSAPASRASAVANVADPDTAPLSTDDAHPCARARTRGTEGRRGLGGPLPLDHREPTEAL